MEEACHKFAVLVRAKGLGGHYPTEWASPL